MVGVMVKGGKTDPGPLTRELASIIKGYLARRGKEQQDLAAAVGISPAQMSRMLNGKKHWDLDQLDRAAAFLDFDALEVLREAAEATADRDLPEAHNVDVGGASDASILDQQGVLTAEELRQRDLDLAAMKKKENPAGVNDADSND